MFTKSAPGNQAGNSFTHMGLATIISKHQCILTNWDEVNRPRCREQRVGEILHSLVSQIHKGVPIVWFNSITVGDLQDYRPSLSVCN